MNKQEQENLIETLRAEVNALYQNQKEEVWYWLGDGNDHLESLICPVLIESEVLRSLIKPPELKVWINIPDKAGEYWVSPFVEGRYIAPRILSVIDYQRPDRGIEVQHDFPHDTIPIKKFTEEYYPHAKWMFIKEPELPA